MSDPRNHTTDPVADHDAAYEPILRDLRAMPKVDAPPDFEFQLRQRIAAASVPRTKWWQRLPALNLGFLRVPAFAYGPLAGAAVIVSAVYVLETRDVLPPPPPAPTQEVQEELQSPEPPRPQSDPLAPASEIERKQREQEAARRRAERSQQAPVRPQAAPAPERRVEQKSDEQLDIPVLRGVVDEDATIDTTKKDSLRTTRIPPSLRPSQQRTEKNPATRKPRDN